jgi:hypothetical protein
LVDDGDVKSSIVILVADCFLWLVGCWRLFVVDCWWVVVCIVVDSCWVLLLLVDLVAS